MADKELQDKLNERKYFARLMAVQALYSKVTKLDDEQIKYLHEQARGQASDKKVDKKTIRSLFHGVQENIVQLDEQIEDKFDDDWNKSRLGELMMAILRCATFEMTQKQTPARIVISEYTDITASFFDDVEVNFINAILAKIARQINADELGDEPQHVSKHDKYAKKPVQVIRNKPKNISTINADKLSLTMNKQINDETLKKADQELDKILDAVAEINEAVIQINEEAKKGKDSE